ncbi:MAG: DUF5655 domain-containing protein [Trueperaceae bacterium]
MGTTPVELDAFFAGRPASRALFEAVRAAVDAAGPSGLRVGRSQVAFRRRVGFAYAWIPGRYLRSDVPLVLSVALRRRDASPRWKEVAEPRPGRFTHHLELRDASEVDDAVRGWIAEAWGEAG